MSTESAWRLDLEGVQLRRMPSDAFTSFEESVCPRPRHARGWHDVGSKAPRLQGLVQQEAHALLPPHNRFWARTASPRNQATKTTILQLLSCKRQISGSVQGCSTDAVTELHPSAGMA